MSREAEIKLTINLNEENVPQEIFWEASESEEEGKKKCEAMMLSMWDQEQNNSLTIDLWTNTMQVGDMNTHYFNTLMKLAETYERATNNKELSDKLRNFANEFVKSAQEAASSDY